MKKKNTTDYDRWESAPGSIRVKKKPVKAGTTEKKGKKK